MSNIDVVIKEIEEYTATGQRVFSTGGMSTAVPTMKLERWLALLRDEKRKIDLPFSGGEEK